VNERGRGDNRALRNETALNADLMRAIDYWVGIPLAFLLTIVYRVQRLIGLATCLALADASVSTGSTRKGCTPAIC
jgi:hypothetical protein